MVGVLMGWPCFFNIFLSVALLRSPSTELRGFGDDEIVRCRGS